MKNSKVSSKLQIKRAIEEAGNDPDLFMKHLHAPFLSKYFSNLCSYEFLSLLYEKAQQKLYNTSLAPLIQNSVDYSIIKLANDEYDRVDNKWRKNMKYEMIVKSRIEIINFMYQYLFFT